MSWKVGFNPDNESSFATGLNVYKVDDLVSAAPDYDPLNYYCLMSENITKEEYVGCTETTK